MVTGKASETKLQAGQEKFRPRKPDKSQSWSLANSVQNLWLVISYDGNTAFITGYIVTK